MYIVQELQTSADNQITFVPAVVREDPQQAESEFYLKVGYAAISSVWRHTVLLYSDDGQLYKFKCYRHDANGTEVEADVDDPLPETEE